MCLLRWDRVEDLLSYGLLILGLLVLPTSLVTGRCKLMEILKKLSLSLIVEILTKIVTIIFFMSVLSAPLPRAMKILVIKSFMSGRLRAPYKMVHWCYISRKLCSVNGSQPWVNHSFRIFKTYLSTNVIISIHLQVVTYLPHLLLAGIVVLRIELSEQFCWHFASVDS